MNIKRYFRKFKQFGVKKSLIFFFLTPAYAVAVKFYRNYLLRFSKIDPDQICFYSFPSFSDNAKVLFEYLVTHYPEKYRFVWLIHREDSIPDSQLKNVTFLKADSYNHRGFTFKALRNVANSKIVFFTHASPFKEMPKRPGQIALNLWHGCGYKDTENKGKSALETNPFDYALVPGKVFIETKSKFWGCPEDMILPFGYPRYDLLNKPSDKAKLFCLKLKKHSSKLVVWLPTFRKTIDNSLPEEKIEYAYEIPLLKCEDDLKKLNSFCAERCIMLCLKRHPKQITYVCEKNVYSNIVFISNQNLVEAGIDLYSIFQYTDALISDYSSVSIDYILLNKPMAFVLDDYDEYKNCRGFVFDEPLHYMPGYHIYSVQDMIVFLTEIANDMDSHITERVAIMSEVHNPCDNYCGRIWGFVQSLVNECKFEYRSDDDEDK